jgi:hypothetical protein
VDPLTASRQADDGIRFIMAMDAELVKTAKVERSAETEARALRIVKARMMKDAGVLEFAKNYWSQLASAAGAAGMTVAMMLALMTSGAPSAQEAQQAAQQGDVAAMIQEVNEGLSELEASGKSLDAEIKAMDQELDAQAVEQGWMTPQDVKDKEMAQLIHEVNVELHGEEKAMLMQAEELLQEKPQPAETGPSPYDLMMQESESEEGRMAVEDIEQQMQGGKVTRR